MYWVELLYAAFCLYGCVSLLHCILMSIMVTHPLLQARCVALESQSAELKGAIAEMTGRMEKYRKSYKDNGEYILYCVRTIRYCRHYVHGRSVT